MARRDGQEEDVDVKQSCELRVRKKGAVIKSQGNAIAIRRNISQALSPASGVFSEFIIFKYLVSKKKLLQPLS